MANEQNLMSIQEVNSRRTPEQHSRDSAKGGKKSGEVRRVRKQFRESFIDELSQGTTQADIVKAVLEKAQQGDIASATFIRDTIGEKPTDKLETKGEQKIVVELQGDVAEWGQ